MFIIQKQFSVCALLLGVLMIGQAVAEDVVTLNDLIAEAMENNPQIQASENAYHASLSRPGQVSALPDPIVSFVSKNSNGNPVPFTELGDDPLSSIGFMWQQEIPYPGKLKLAGKIANQDAASMAADFDGTRSNVVAELKQAYYEYFRTSRSLEILQQSRELLKQFEEIAEARYRVGNAIQQDVLRAQLEISILTQRTTRLDEEEAVAVARINRILNRPVDIVLQKPLEVSKSTLSASMEDLQTEFISSAPAIRSKEALLERERLNVELAKKQYRPDFMTSAEYGYSPNFPDMWEFQIGLRIPIWYKKKQSAGVAEATYSMNRAERDLVADKHEIAFNIKQAYLEIQLSEKLLTLYEQAINPQSNLALESGIASYQAGKADFLTILTNFLTVLEYRMNYVEELSKHESAIARLEQVIGHPITTGDGGGK
ncbi:MAG: hypothetical protein C5B54_05815 [Acidobacteria bacterium]|nr:MAG: hypothetical protein C5B54_05815 [Acidobacteriota bacterium]